MSSLSNIFRGAAVWSVIAVIGAAGNAAAATSGPEGEPGLQADIQGTTVKPGSATAGRFLAARHAEVVGDLVSAADLTAGIIAEVSDYGNNRRRAHLIMVSAGRFEMAADLARDVIKSNPADPLAIYTLYVEAMRAGRFDEALELPERVPTSGVNGIVVPLLKAWALAGLEQTDTALLTLEKLAGSNGLAPIAGLHQGLIAHIGGDTGRAEQAFRLALEKSNGRPSLQLVDSFARFLVEQGQNEEAAELVNQFTIQNPDTLLIDPVKRVVAGDVEPVKTIGDVQQGAAEVFRNVSGLLNRERLRTESMIFVRMSLGLESNNPTALYSLGQLLEARSRADLAIDVYRQIATDTPYHWYARLSIADALHGQEKSDPAIEILRAMAVEREDRSDAVRALADVLRISERFDEAVEAYDLAFERQGRPVDWRLLYTRGIALERAKIWDRAEKDFLEALALEPDQPLVLNYLGYSWVEQGIELERARAMIETAVAKRPNDGYITDSLGWVLYRLGQYPAAVEHLERAVALEPGDPVINDHLGDAYWLAGRKQEARFQWVRALSLNPEPEAATEIRMKIDGEKAPEPLPPGKKRDI
jgi:tetratricopeptide (TPR) repeat protein